MTVFLYVSVCFAQALEAQERALTKTQAELKTISLAAREGVEAASRVKELQHDVKKLGEDNITLTKNYESERVSRAAVNL